MSTVIEGIEFSGIKAQGDRLRSSIDARIAEVLDHGRFIMGPEVAELEAGLAALAPGTEVVSCSSGTDALTLCLMAAGVEPGDAVIVPSFTFTATAEVVALLGAVPVFADVEADTFNMGPDQAQRAIAAAGDAGLRVKAVMPVDMFGLPADYDALAPVAQAAGAAVIADAAQSFGGELRQRPVGSLAPLTATSFFPSKPLGAYGDGGAVFSTDGSCAQVMRSLRVHGKGTHKYDAVRIGLNARLDTFQAAVLLSKLEVFREEIQARREVAQRYGEMLPAALAPHVPEGFASAWAQFTVKVEHRDKTVELLTEAGVPTAIYYPVPLHLQPAYRHFPAAGELTVSTELAAQVLSLPMHPYLEPSQQRLVVDALAAAL